MRKGGPSRGRPSVSSYAFDSYSVNPLLYGSMTMVQVYVPGARPLAAASAGSVFPVADSPTMVLLSSRQMMCDAVPQAASDVAVAVMSVSGVSVNVTVL